MCAQGASSSLNWDLIEQQMFIREGRGRVFQAQKEQHEQNFRARSKHGCCRTKKWFLWGWSEACGLGCGCRGTGGFSRDCALQGPVSCSRAWPLPGSCGEQLEYLILGADEGRRPFRGSPWEQHGEQPEQGTGSGGWLGTWW